MEHLAYGRTQSVTLRGDAQGQDGPTAGATAREQACNALGRPRGVAHQPQRRRPAHPRRACATSAVWQTSGAVLLPSLHEMLVEDAEGQVGQERRENAALRTS